MKNVDAVTKLSPEGETSLQLGLPACFRVQLSLLTGVFSLLANSKIRHREPEMPLLPLCCPFAPERSCPFGPFRQGVAVSGLSGFVGIAGWLGRLAQQVRMCWA